MSKRALILYHHGLGDVIQLTPHLRYLHEQGYKTDLMCRTQVITSHLLDSCEYVNEMIVVPNPWDNEDYRKGLELNFALFMEKAKDYDWIGCANHLVKGPHKIDITSWELGIEPKEIEDRSLEVFISEDHEHWSRDCIESRCKNGFIHVHTQIENHTEHNWDATEWIKENLPDLPIIDTGYGGSHYMIRDDINNTFYMMQNAKHRVYSSSVMVHAAEAMGLTMDVINYGKEDRKVWPLNQDLVIRIRENGQWLRNPKLELEAVDKNGLKEFDVRHKKVLLNVQEYEKILEIGPGSGKSSCWLAKHGKDITLLDKNINGLIDFANICGNKNYYYKITDRHEFEDNAFECVFACQVLEHIPEWKKTIENMLKWASKKVIFTVPREKSYFSPDHINFFKKEDFEYIKGATIEEIVTKESDYETDQRCIYVEIDVENN